MTLTMFKNARANGRRFHAETIGRDVDPDRCFGDFLCLVQSATKAVSQHERASAHSAIQKRYVRKAALAEGTGATGGYTVPVEYYRDIVEYGAEQAIFRRFCHVQPMVSRELVIPLPDTDQGSTGVSPFYGGVQLKWGSSSASSETAEPKWRAVSLVAKDLIGYAYASNDLTQDAGKPLEEYLKWIFGTAVGFYEDLVFFNGALNVEPVGIINCPAAGTVSRAAGSQIALADVGNMIKQLIPGGWSRAIWCCSPTALYQISQLSDVGGKFIFAPGDDGSIALLYGRPLFVTEKVPALGSRGDLTLFDPALYVVGDRGTLDVAFSDQEPTGFLANQSAWRIVQRVDGQTVLDKPVALQNGDTAASVVVLV